MKKAFCGAPLSAQAAAPFNTEVAGSSHKEKVRSVHEKSPDGFRGFCGADGARTRDLRRDRPAF